MAQCLTCYGMVEIDRDDVTFICRGMDTGECMSPNIGTDDVARLQAEREDDLSRPEYREEDAHHRPPYY